MSEKLKIRFINERLDIIKSYVKNCIKEYDYEKAYKVDEIVKEELERIYDDYYVSGKRKYIARMGLNSNEKAELNNLSLYYYALYNDNLSLLKKLIDSGYKFTDRHLNMDFNVLNKDITKYFDEDEYVLLLNRNSEECHRFFDKVMTITSKNINYRNRSQLLSKYDEIREKLLFNKMDDCTRSYFEDKLKEISKSLNTTCEYKYDENVREILFKKFAYILNKKSDIATVKNRDGAIYRNLLIPDTLLTFDSETILNFKECNKKLIEDNYDSRDIYPLTRIRNIIYKCPNYYSNLHLSNDILGNLTDSEIINLTPDLEEIYGKADSLHKVREVHELLKKDFSLDNEDLISEEVLDSLSIDEIINLSDKAATKIKNVLANKRKILNNLDGKYILSRKIKGIAMRDQTLKNIGIRK